MSVQVSGSTRRLGLSAAPRILRLLIPSQSRVRLQQAAVLRLLRQPQAAAPVAPRQLPPVIQAYTVWKLQFTPPLILLGLSPGPPLLQSQSLSPGPRPICIWKVQETPVRIGRFTQLFQYFLLLRIRM